MNNVVIVLQIILLLLTCYNTNLILEYREKCFASQGTITETVSVNEGKSVNPL